VVGRFEVNAGKDLTAYSALMPACKHMEGFTYALLDKKMKRLMNGPPNNLVA
jgi:hypothetical protein